MTLKDLKGIEIGSTRVCCIANKYEVFACTNNLSEGKINAYVRITDIEDKALGRTVLFSIRDGSQILCDNLTENEQLIIPQDYIARLKESLSICVEVFGEHINVWKRLVKYLNEIHANDKIDNFEPLPEDLPIPEFRYIEEWYNHEE